jgi:hypothetical protein
MFCAQTLIALAWATSIVVASAVNGTQSPTSARRPGSGPIAAANWRVNSPASDPVLNIFQLPAM